MSATDTLKQGIAALGLDLPADAAERLLAFGHLLIKWNKVYNLTAIRNEAQVVTHHLLDSLSVLPHLAGVNRLVDVGSGGGLPGAPEGPETDPQVVEQLEIAAKYQGYIDRQQDEVARQADAEATRLPADLDYASVRGLSKEVQGRLNQHKPETIGQASRIQGITPAAISLLLVWLKRSELARGREQRSA